MALFDIVITDLKVRFNHTQTAQKQSFPRTGYRFELRGEKILLLESGTGQQVLSISSIDDVGTITDSRTVPGAVGPFTTLDELFEIMDAAATPFFFRELGSGGGGGGGTTDFILEDGTINPLSIDGTGEVRAFSTNITPTVFTGTGLDDATSGGTYTGSYRTTITVTIDGDGATNTFTWCEDKGVLPGTCIQLVPITGGAQVLQDGITITFGSITGHTIGDEWVFEAQLGTNSIGFNSVTPTNRDTTAVQNLEIAEGNAFLPNRLTLNAESKIVFDSSGTNKTFLEQSTGEDLITLSSTYLNSIGFNSITPDKDDVVMLEEGRFSAGAGALLSQAGSNVIMGDYNNSGESWYTSNDVAGATTGITDFSKEYYGIEDGSFYAGAEGGNYLHIAKTGNISRINTDSSFISKSYTDVASPSAPILFAHTNHGNGKPMVLLGLDGQSSGSNIGRSYYSLVIHNNYQTQNTFGLGGGVFPVYIGTRTGTSSADVINSSSIAGDNILINKSNYGFAQNFEVQGGIGAYTVDPTTNGAWGARSIPDKAYSNLSPKIADALPTDTATIELDTYPLTDGTYKTLTAGTQNITLNATTAESTTEMIRWTLEFTQDATTARTLTLGTNFLTPGGVAPVVSATLSATDTLVFETDSAGKHRLVEHRKAYA